MKRAATFAAGAATVLGVEMAAYVWAVRRLGCRVLGVRRL